MIVLHCPKPRFLSLLVSPAIYRSKSAKFQLCITARRVIIFRRKKKRRRISVIGHRSASNKLAVDSLVFLACG